MNAGRWLLVAWCALAAQQSRDLRLEQEPAPNPLGDRGVRYALVVGISNYLNLPPQAQLHYAHRDAEEFAAFLRTGPGGALPADRIRVLTNEKATLAAIRASLETWLVGSAGPNDIVYVFFAGHGVVAERDEPYFVAYDSDPQNLHATALAFEEVDSALSGKLRAGLAIVTIDACHSGSLGWTSFSEGQAGRVSEPAAAIGHGDRSFLKLLASRPSERSFEDERWNGGQGVFTYALLDGLRGRADGDNDGFVRASELIDYIAKLVPEQTQSRQHPRVAGTFDARLPLSVVPRAPAVSRNATLEVTGPPGVPVYVDNAFQGSLRRDGTLRIETISLGEHRLSADLTPGQTLEGKFTLAAFSSRLEIPRPRTSPLLQLQARIAAGQILGPDGAWEFYRTQNFAAQRAAANALLSASLEELGQACVNDYVQSTAIGLKKAMLRRAVEAYEVLKVFRPGDKGVESRALFCQARLQIAEGRFETALDTLRGTLHIDSQFACAYNAMGVALERLKRLPESRKAFEMAARLTPEWALPPFQIASQLVARGELRQAVPYLEKSVQYNPRSVTARWNLMHVHRLLGQIPEVEKDAAALAGVNASYAPAYLELGRAYEAAGDHAKAADAYDAYLLLAPNFADSNEIRGRAQRNRSLGERHAPSLRRPGEK